MNQETKDKINYGLKIAIIIGLMILILNQTFTFLYHTRLLVNPCDICKSLNPINEIKINLSNITYLPMPAR